MSHAVKKKPSVTPSGKIRKVQASTQRVSDLEENLFKKRYIINVLNGTKDNSVWEEHMF